MKKLCIIFASFFALTLMGCNGHNEDTSENTPQVVTNVELLLLDSDGNAKQSFTKNETITLQAKVTDQNNAIIANKSVSFSASIGTLEVSSKLTNSEGIAIVQVSNNQLSIGAGVASASVGEINAEQIDYEFIESIEINVVLSSYDSEGNAKQSFTKNEVIILEAIVTDENNDIIANRAVNFSASIGSLDINSKLTNSEGIAIVNISNNELSIGAGIASASVGEINAQPIDYEFVDSNNINVELSLFDNTGNAEQSFSKNEIITLRAKVTDENDVIITNKAVNFSASIGNLDVPSKLTNSEGFAIVYITNETLALGAGTVEASVDEISSGTVDYEFIESSEVIVLPSLTTTMTLESSLVNQFKADQEVQITSILTDGNGQPLAGENIHYTADIGTFDNSTLTSLTNSQGVAVITLSGNEGQTGAGVLTASYTLDESSNTTINNSFNYQILSADAVIDSDIRLGYFDENNAFIEGVIELSIADNTISAGGTLGLSVDLVDENGDLIVTPVPVTFTSDCVQNGNAAIDESVLSISGTASSTFADISCAGITGTTDVLVASVAVNNITNSASETITINGEQLGSIEFVSAEPNSIVLKGTGGQNKQETSSLTFRVKSTLGNVLPLQEVNFALSTSVGGITLSRTSGPTNSQGLITTQVSAGTVPTAVRVTASASMDFNGEMVAVQSQSDLLSINTGLPEQRSMTMAATVLNPEAHNISGVESNITVWLSDNFHNPVPDGTTVNFTTEGGNIEPSCSTVNGSCSVIWESSEPRVANHRVTILATALGHETFFDTNGNNVFDDADGEPILDAGDSNNLNVDSGFGNYAAQSSGFIDMSEAWRDDNENSIYDDGETFLDFDSDGAFSVADSLFNGPQCQGSNCADEDKRNIHVRKAIRLVMASSGAEVRLTNGDGSIVYQDSLTGESTALNDVANGGSQEFNFSFADTGTPNQTMPLGTTVTVAVSAGTVAGQTDVTVGNNNLEGFSNMNFFVIQEAGADPQVAILTITITSPNGIVTSVSRSMSLL